MMPTPRHWLFGRNPARSLAQVRAVRRRRAAFECLEDRALLTITSLSVAASTLTSTFSQAETFTATLAFPSSSSILLTGGTVTFYDGATSLGTDTLINNQATLTTTTLALAPHTITASYGGTTGGTTDFAASTSGVEPTSAQTVVPASGLFHPEGVAVDGSGDVFIADADSRRVLKVTPGVPVTVIPATTVSIAAPTVTYNGNAIVTLTVGAGGAPTPIGVVTLSVDGGTAQSATLDALGTATFTLSSPSAGNHTLPAAYAAQGNYAGSSADSTLLVNPAASSITVSAPTVTYKSDGT
jgi:hypothetical protein